VGVSGAQRSGSAQHRSAPTARTERRQAAREAALFWQTGDEAEREALLSSPPLALRACLVLSVFEVMELDNKLALDGHNGKRRTWRHF